MSQTQDLQLQSKVNHDQNCLTKYVNFVRCFCKQFLNFQYLCLLDFASDKQCKCNRKLGSSETFKQHLSQHTTPSNQAVSNYNVMDNLKNIFIDIDPSTGKNKFETEFNLVETMQKRLQSEYQDLFNGNINEFVSMPETFQYEKDISISIQGLEERIAVERAQGQEAYGFNDSEITKMENELKNMKGDVAESLVHSKLKLFFAKSRGVLFHSFHPESVMQPLVGRAASQRQNVSSLALTPLEVKLAHVLNINVITIEQEADGIIQRINSTLSNPPTFSCKDLDTELEKQKKLEKKKFTFIQSMLKQISKCTGQNKFSFEDAKKAFVIGILHHNFKPDGEMDFIGVLPDDGLIISFEVKYQVVDPSKAPTKLLNDATRQTKNNEAFISRVFGPMLSSSWRLVKVPIILQQDTTGTLIPAECCSHCSKYIISSGSLNDLPQWFKQTGLTTTQLLKTGLNSSYVEYLRMIEVIITSISIKNNLSSWQRVVGSNYEKPIAAGHTQIQAPSRIPKKSSSKQSMLKKFSSMFLGKTTDDHISFDEAKSKVHDAQKMLFFSKLQLSLLNISHHLSLILWGDYGTGKLI